MLETCPENFIQLAHRLADEASNIISGYFRKSFHIATKTDATPVTAADKEAEEVMRTILEEVQPEHGIFGEEFGSDRSDADYAWYLDPIDGTKAFIAGVPVFGTLIGLAYRGQPILGIIDQAISGERWVGAQGHPCTLNGTKVNCRKGLSLSDAVMFTTSPYLYTGSDLQALERLQEKTSFARYGVDCYAFGLVASGLADIALECGVNDYDYCALVPVIAAAGGVMTNWEGNPLILGRDKQIIAAANPELLTEALQAMRE